MYHAQQIHISLLMSLALVVGCGGEKSSSPPTADTGPEILEDTSPDVPNTEDATTTDVPVIEDTELDVDIPDSTIDDTEEDITDAPEPPDAEPDTAIEDTIDDTTPPDDADDAAVEDTFDAGAPCDDDTPCPLLSEACKAGVCVPIVCTPNEATCNDDGTVSKCDPFGSAVFTFGCPGGFECHEGQCKPPVANVVLVFDTSGSMNQTISGSGSLVWPDCEDLTNPKTRIGYSKAAFNQALETLPINPVRFSLLHFPQTEDYDSTPSCKSGHYDGDTKITGDPSVHITGPGDDWFSEGIEQVVSVPFASNEDDQLNEVMIWMDGAEELVELTAITNCNSTTCPGFCDGGKCYLHTNPELRADGSTPLGRTLFYAGEYIRRFVLVEGKPCSTKADCGSYHYQCQAGTCRDPLYNCRETVIVLFTDGGETSDSGSNDFFNPVNQAKRLFMGLGCQADTDCAKDALCTEGLCKPKPGLDTVLGQVASSPGLGVCNTGFEVCNISTNEGCAGGDCVDVDNSYEDNEENIQTLLGYEGQHLRIRTHVMDASEGEEEMNVEIAFWGGGQYIPVDAADTAAVVQAIQQLTDLKFTIGCE